MILELIKEKNLITLQRILKPFSLKKRESIMSEKINRSSLLYIAVKYKSVDIVDFFLKECRANPNDTGYENGTQCPCLWKATELNDLKTVKSLLQHGADIDDVNSLETTALFVACSCGNLDMVRFLWCSGADVNSTDHEGNTCLMASIAYPNLCRYLIGVGGRVNAVNAYGDSALVLAIKSTQKETCIVLLDAGANPFFINHFGVNAVFLMTYMNLEICPDYFYSIYQNSKNCIALALEMLSCQEMLKGETYIAVAYWKNALQLHHRPESTRIYRCPNTFRSNLQPILSLLKGRDAQVLKFIEFRVGLKHPFTLDLLKRAVLKINRINNYVHLFSFFIKVIQSSENEIFLRISEHIDDMLETFDRKYSRLVDKSSDILKSLADYLEDANNRLRLMTGAAKLSHACQIDFCHKAILKYMSIFTKKCPDQIEEIYEHITRIVKLNARGMKNASLLHFCIENNYSVAIAMLVVAQGANVNSMDDNGKRPAHYALTSSEYNTKEMIDFFLKYGLRFHESTEENSCLPCLLNKNNLLKDTLHYTTLQCLAAKIVAKNCVFGEYSFPRTLQIVTRAHSRI